MIHYHMETIFNVGTNILMVKHKGNQKKKELFHNVD